MDFLDRGEVDMPFADVPFFEKDVFLGEVLGFVAFVTISANYFITLFEDKKLTMVEAAGIEPASKGCDQ